MKRTLLISLLIVVCLSPGLWGQGLVINELMSDNDLTISDEFGDYSDWIELHNAGVVPVNLSDYYLSDDLLEPQEWHIPDSILDPGAFLLIFASDRDTLFHANFKISSAGESIYLFDLSGDLVYATDSVPLKGDQSWGRVLDGSETWKVFHQPSPGSSNNLGNALAFSHPRGFYRQSFMLEIFSEREAEIRYTLDGSEPTLQDPVYKGPLLIDEREGDADVWSLIPSTQPPPVEVIKSWEPPLAPSKKATVIKCRSFSGGLPTSPVYSATYFVDPLGEERYSLPVFSFICDSMDLFDYDSGIYVPGIHADPSNNRTGNYFERGIEWEKPVHIEYFESDGDVAFVQDGGLRIHGQYSRRASQKSLRLYARDEYGKKYFEYPLFPGRDLEDYKRFVLRSAITTFDSRFGDAFIADLTRNLDYEIQDYQPVIVFLNGEYWGVHNMREYLDEHYIHALYPEVHEDSLNMLRMKWTVMEGEIGNYQDIHNFVESNSLVDQANFDYVAERIDTSNFLDYIVTEIYMANMDWPGNNITRWQSQEEGSKWRWVLNDLDASFRYPYLDMIAQSTDSTQIKWPNPQWSTLLIRKMLENPGFKKKFICRSLELMQKEFHPDQILAPLDDFSSLFVPEMEEHILRWNFPESKQAWMNFYDSTMVRFAQTRPAYYMEHLEKAFGLNQGELGDLCDCYEPGDGLEVAFGSPEPGTVVSYPFDLEAEGRVLSGGNNVRMSLMLDGAYIGTDLEAPYLWDSTVDTLLEGLDMGPHELEILAYEADQLSTVRAFSSFFVMKNTPGDEFVLGDSSEVDGSPDLWTSNMVINESETFSNMSPDTLLLQVGDFSFYAMAEADPLTPFLVRVNGDDDFTVVAIGDTRENNVYDIGENRLPFKEIRDTVITLGPGEVLATGFLDAYPNGIYGGSGSVIPYDELEPADEIWFTGASTAKLSGSVMEGLSPIFQTPPRTNLRRNYHYNINFIITDTLGIRETTGWDEVLYPELSIFPNPLSEGMINIVPANCQGPVRIIIADMQGRILYNERSEDSPVLINSDVLPGPGTYIVRIENELGVAHGKLIKTAF